MCSIIGSSQFNNFAFDFSEVARGRRLFSARLHHPHLSPAALSEVDAAVLFR